MNKWCVQWAVVIWLLLGVAGAQAVEVRSQVRLLNSAPIYLGQQVTVEIELQVDGWFAGATGQPLFTLDDALVVRQPSSATNGSRRIEGRNWATQVWQRTFFPQRAGEWRFPSQQFSLRVGGEASDGISVGDRAVSSAPIIFNVVSLPSEGSPDEVAGLAPVAAKLQLQSRWSGLLTEPLPVGAVVRQRLELSGEQISNGLLPSLAAQASAVLRGSALTLYASELERLDEWRAGDLHSRIVWQLDYLLAEPGSYSLPALSVDYWQPQQQRWLRVAVPAKSVTVDAENRAPALSSKKHVVVWLVVIVSGLFLIGAALHWRKRKRRAVSQLRRALVLGGDSAVAYRALCAYLAEQQILDTPSQWASSGSAELSALVAALNRCVAESLTLDKRLIWRHWRGLLKNQQLEKRRLSGAAEVSLPPLNPR